MGSVKQEKNGLWTIRYDGTSTDGTRKQKQEGGFRTKPLAAAELKKREADALRGTLPVGNDITLSDFIDLWLERLKKVKRAPKTIRFYESIADNHIKPYFGKTKLCNLFGNTIEDYYFYLSDNTNLDVSSIHHNHKTLRACLNKAVKWGYISITPMVNVEPPPQKKSKIEFWEPKEIQLGLKLFEGTPFEWYVNVALLTGLRLGEVCALNERCFDFKNNKFYIYETSQRIKGEGIVYKKMKTDDSAADMPLTKDMAKVINKRKLEIKNDRVRNADIYDKSRIGYLAVWPDGHVMDPTFISGQFTNILKQYNKTAKPEDKLPQITFHGLRHSCASWLLYNGVDMKTLQEILRHSNYKITADTYSHILMDKKREALEKISL